MSTEHARSSRDAADLRIAGVAHLRRADPRLGRVIEAVGACRLPKRHGRYASLVRAIIGQQVSVKAAFAVHERLRAAAGGRVTPAALARMSAADLRACGVSRQKAAYLSDLTAHVQEGRLRLDRLGTLPDEEVVHALTKVKGIGAWSADMFLMFVLNRPDILPTGDLGIRNGFTKVYRLRKEPSHERMTALAECWRPYRTVGSWYLWRSLELDAVP